MVFSRVVGLAEKAGKHVELLTVPGTDADVRLMKNYKREGYLVRNLPDPQQILSEKSFLVLDNAGAPWFPIAIEHNPRFTWKVIAPIDSARRLIQVDQQP